jgi:hypothetical protein
MDAAAAPERHPLRLAVLVVAGVVLLAALAALGLYIWLRGYSPLDARGGSLPRYAKGEPYDTPLTLHNSGRFAVTLIGLGATAQPEVQPVALVPDRLRLEPGDSATVVIRWRLDCDGSRNGNVSAARVPLRYRYLSMFRRTERVALPYAVTLRCGMAPQGQP